MMAILLGVYVCVPRHEYEMCGCFWKFKKVLRIEEMICLLAYRYSVENAYLEEKEDTCNALGEIAENSG